MAPTPSSGLIVRRRTRREWRLTATVRVMAMARVTPLLGAGRSDGLGAAGAGVLVVVEDEDVGDPGSEPETSN